MTLYMAGTSHGAPKPSRPPCVLTGRTYGVVSQWRAKDTSDASDACSSPLLFSSPLLLSSILFSSLLLFSSMLHRRLVPLRLRRRVRALDPAAALPLARKADRLEGAYRPNQSMSLGKSCASE